MKKTYTIKIAGVGIRVTAQSLDANQAKLIETYAKKENLTLNDLSESMEAVLNDYDHYDTNLWDMEATLPDGLHLIVEDDQGRAILNCALPETGGDIGQNEDDAPTYSALPNTENPNVLVYQEDNKGVIYGCVFESVSTPFPKDFTFKYGRLITPDDDLTFIKTFYFRGKELENDYEFSSARNIGTTSRLFLIKNK
jgi:hypothetical protein